MYVKVLPLNNGGGEKAINNTYWIFKADFYRLKLSSNNVGSLNVRANVIRNRNLIIYMRLKIKLKNVFKIF